MNRNFTLILVVLAVLAVAGAFLMRDTKPRNFAEGTPTPEPMALVTIPVTDVTAVGVVGSSGSYTLTRAGSGWNVDSVPADSETVEGFVKRFVETKPMQALPEDRNPVDYGFGQPQITVTLKAISDTVTLVFGDDVVPADQASVYLRLNDTGPIYVVSNAESTTLKGWLTNPPAAPTPTPASPDPSIEGTFPLTGTNSLTETDSPSTTLEVMPTDLVPEEPLTDTPSITELLPLPTMAAITATVGTTGTVQPAP